MKPVNNGILASQIGKPRILDTGVVDGGGHGDLSVFMDVVFPWDSRYLFIKLLGIFSLELIEEKKDPLSRPDIEIEPHRITHRAFRRDIRNTFGCDRQA